MSDVDLEALADAYNTALAAEKAGELPVAIEAYRRALALDPDDRGGVAVRLAALKAGEVPDRAPEAYVAMLFDQHASRFDEMLVEQLGYSVPIQIREMFEAHRVPRAARLLDLGCGTGLSGESLADWADHLTGCDLSEAMLDEAYDKGAYDALYVADAEGFLAEGEGGPWDIIVATDMVPYLGALEGLIAGLAARVCPGGYVAFSIETLDEQAFAGAPFTVGPKHRFAHSPDYVRALLEGRGFTLRALDPIVVRYDEGAPVPGHLILARKAM